MNAPIKRHPVLQAFSRDHHKALLLSRVLRKDVPDYKGMPVSLSDKTEYLKAHFANELKPHFLNEENILFAFCAGKEQEIDDLIDELIKEHAILTEMIIQLETEEEPEELLHKFGILLEAHIRKEERMLFNRIQEIFSETELQELGKLMEGSGKE